MQRPQENKYEWALEHIGEGVDLNKRLNTIYNDANKKKI